MAQVLAIPTFVLIWFSLFLEVYSISEDDNEISGNVTSGVKTEPLYLTPLIKSGKIQEAQTAAEVKELSGMEGTLSYSGYLTVNEKYNSNMFFWFFPSQDDYKNDPVILWLQGGPGRSSLRGLFIENGPYEIRSKKLKQRKPTWTQNHSVIYLDNPVGTGFSFTEYDDGYHTNMTTIGEDLYQAVLQFFQLFPHLQKNDFYIAGQSYAGKYVPTLAHLIHEKNPATGQKINLVGIAIGNGLVDPINQIKYSEFLYQIGLLNAKGKKEMEVQEQKIIKQAQNKEWLAAHKTFMEMIAIYNGSIYQDLTGFLNVFNLLEPVYSSDKQMKMSKYLSKTTVRRAIHAGEKHPYFAFSSYVQDLLEEDLMIGVAPFVAELINYYRVLMYNGQLDIMVPYRTTVNFLSKLKFNGSDGYDDAKRHHWYVHRTLAGYATQVGNLTEVLVRNSGHSVPEDQIEWATDMIYRFTRKQTFECCKDGKV